MLHDESTASLLRAWLIKTLQPVCDADPEALADYVLALLKHDAAEPDLRKMFISQLEEFLEQEASKFVDTLFAALRSKSYLPYESVKSESHEVGIPIPLDDFVPNRGRKRNLEADENEHPSPKGPRLNSDDTFARFGRRSVPVNSRGGTGEISTSFSYQGARHDNQYYRPPSGFGGRGRKGVCRDYYNNGFCARGSLCQYSHGDDALVPPMLYTNIMPGVPPFMSMYSAMPSFTSNAQYDPHESRMEMGIRPKASRPMNDPVPSTELPVVQDLTPQDPVEEATNEPVIQPNGFTHNFGTPRKMQQHQTHVIPPTIPPMFSEGMPELYNMGLSVTSTGADLSPMPTGVAFKQGSTGQSSGETYSPRSAPRDDKTLVVEKIPVESLSMEAVNHWFKKFGSITNVAIDSASAKALVTFSSHTEAQAAWKSQEAIFGNRFVKVFWHRPLEGQGMRGQRALAASAPFLKNLTISQQQETSLPVDVSTPKFPVMNAVALAARQRALEQQISQQKVLISRLGTAKSSEEKEEILASLKKLQDKPLPPPIAKPSTDSSHDHVPPKMSYQKDKSGLNSDSQAEQEPTSQNHYSEDDPKTAALLEKLTLLKAEATQLGIPDVEINSESRTLSWSYNKPSRGRGGSRGRGFTAGSRGGLSRGSMKLDNRPRRLLISGISSSEETIQAVRTYYQNLGNLELFGKVGDEQLVAQFWSRSAAESALASGTDIPSVGKIKVGWHTGPTPPFIPVSTPSLPPRPIDLSLEVKADYSAFNGHTDSAVPDAEESGWGQSFDDEDESRRRRSRSRSFS